MAYQDFQTERSELERHHSGSEWWCFSGRGKRTVWKDKQVRELISKVSDIPGDSDFAVKLMERALPREQSTTGDGSISGKAAGLGATQSGTSRRKRYRVVCTWGEGCDAGIASAGKALRDDRCVFLYS
jgi:hypothetical protein